MRPPVLAALGAGVALLGVLAASCTPDVAKDPAPEAMQFDPQAAPPRVPQPTGLILNPLTGRIDFSLAGTPVPADCSAPPAGWSQAECEFDQYLQSLDGFPTVSPAQAPATANLDTATLTVGTNVVVVAAKHPALVSDVAVGFDPVGRNLTLHPRRSWTLGEVYLVAVRGYENGVRAESGRQVVGSPTQFLLKQPTSLTCGAIDADSLDPHCPAFALLLQGRSHEEAAMSVFQLEAIRQAYQPAWNLMEQVGGVPRSDTAVLWSFPIHSFSVPELDPKAGLVPRVVAANEIRVAVQGPVDPSTVTPFVLQVQYGSIVVMDLTAALTGDLPGSFPIIDTSFSNGEIVITGRASFAPLHTYGLFFTNALRDPTGRPLVPSPVSVLLSLRGPLIDGQRHSTISTVSDGDANVLEVGRSNLGKLLTDPSFAGLTGLRADQLVYCFPFDFPVLP